LWVPDYAVLNVTSEFGASVTDKAARELLNANLGENFGTVYHEGYPLWRYSKHREPSTDFLDSLEDVLAFDAILMNTDRQIVNPNLLSRGDSWFLIDHTRAILLAKKPQEPGKLSPAHIRSHCAYPALRQKHREYSRLMNHWRERITPDALTQLRSWVPAGWDTSGGDLDWIFGFLERRPECFEAIQRTLRETVR
jgi:hypothetical protein